MCNCSNKTNLIIQVINTVQKKRNYNFCVDFWICLAEDPFADFLSFNGTEYVDGNRQCFRKVQNPH